MILKSKENSDSSEADKSKTLAITDFLKALFAGFSSSKPNFFFTDKYWSQITSISTVFKVARSLCLWHVKRTIKNRMKDEKRNGEVNVNKDFKTALLSLMTKHFK